MDPTKSDATQTAGSLNIDTILFGNTPGTTPQQQTYCCLFVVCCCYCLLLFVICLLFVVLLLFCCFVVVSPHPSFPCSVQPNESIVQGCVGMGFTRQEAEVAAITTHNSSLNDAIQFLLDRKPSEPPLSNLVCRISSSSSSSSDALTSPPQPISATTVSSLTQMGYSDADAEAAVRAVGDSLEQAVQWLMDRPSAGKFNVPPPAVTAPEFKWSIVSPPPSGMMK